MAALLATIARPIISGTFVTPSKLLGACCRAIARYFARREAIARLREFSDAELRDIGLARSEIEPAVRGLEPRLPDWPRR
ncbi:DUF1127 domain-containing protein [Bosea sp. ASV33]|uniref:DUF1127 domain-containing protein n=1 Tax=Bosea sp. ASV33 TaxID=2795106 RepID=UPI0018EE3E36|nr:DUF1127 domain-containing protein [Bosea sp. ASV33]